MRQVSGDSTFLADVGPKTRNMIKKCNKLGYGFSTFQYNDYLDAMHAVDTSTPHRQGLPMTKSYVNPLKPIADEPWCLYHRQVYLAGWLNDQLVAYTWLALCGDVAVINRILGHAEHQAGTGLMNGLSYFINWYCAKNTHCKYVNYRTMESTTDGLEAFKKHNGFKPMRVEVVV